MEWFCSPRPRCKNINKAGQQKLYSNPYHLFMCAFLSVRSVCVRVHRFNAEVCAQGGVCALTCLCSSVRGDAPSRLCIIMLMQRYKLNQDLAGFIEFNGFQLLIDCSPCSVRRVIGRRNHRRKKYVTIRIRICLQRRFIIWIIIL